VRVHTIWNLITHGAALKTKTPRPRIYLKAGAKIAGFKNFLGLYTF